MSADNDDATDFVDVKRKNQRKYSETAGAGGRRYKQKQSKGMLWRKNNMRSQKRACKTVEISEDDDFDDLIMHDGKVEALSEEEDHPTLKSLDDLLAEKGYSNITSSNVEKNHPILKSLHDLLAASILFSSI